MLWRALRGVGEGRYIDVGANHPMDDSISMAFYEHGWSGLTVEPDPQYAALQRQQRPRDIVSEAAITPHEGGVVPLHVVDGTGLSTIVDGIASAHSESGYATHTIEVPTRRLDRILEEIGWQGVDIHFMCVDTEGSERGVLESIDLDKWRPWVLCVEATEPNSTISTRDQWEDLVLACDYRFCLFDGLSCFYVAAEHQERLAPALSYGACILDGYTTRYSRMIPVLQGELASEAARRQDEVAKCQGEVAKWQGEVARWQGEVARWKGQWVSTWAAAMRERDEAAGLRRQLADLWHQYHVIGTAHHFLSQDHHKLSQDHHKLSQDHHQLAQDHHRLAQDNHRLAQDHHRLSEEAHQLRLRLQLIEGSRAWRLTEPVRKVARRLPRAEG